MKKIIPLILGISFFAAFYARAVWQEPSQTPPDGNVAAPVNVGTTPQAKAGRLDVTALYDYDNPSFYLNPSGESHFLGNLTVNGNISSANWPYGVPSGMIAMFDAACPSGWTRFAALDDKFPRGASSYGATGGGETHTHNYSGATGQTSEIQEAQPPYQYGTWTPTRQHTHPYSGVTDAGSSLPPYLNVIWCKKI